MWRIFILPKFLQEEFAGVATNKAQTARPKCTIVLKIKGGNFDESQATDSIRKME